MQGRSPSRFRRQLEVLVRHEVEFIVVGGVAAVLGGAPVLTLDLDVVYRRSSENLPKLAAALRSIHAIYNDPIGRRIVPDVSKLETVRLNSESPCRNTGPSSSAPHWPSLLLPQFQPPSMPVGVRRRRAEAKAPSR